MASTLPGSAASGALGGPTQVELILRQLHLPYLPSAISSLRLRPYVRVTMNDDWKLARSTRPVRGWRGELLRFVQPFTLTSINPATDQIYLEVWHRRRLRRDILLGAGSYPVAQLMQLSQQNLALDVFLPIHGVGMKSVLGSATLTSAAASGYASSALIGFAHVIILQERPLPTLTAGMGTAGAQGIGTGMLAGTGAGLSGGPLAAGTGMSGQQPVSTMAASQGQTLPLGAGTQSLNTTGMQQQDKMYGTSLGQAPQGGGGVLQNQPFNQPPAGIQQEGMFAQPRGEGLPLDAGNQSFMTPGMQQQANLYDMPKGQAPLGGGSMLQTQPFSQPAAGIQPEGMFAQPGGQALAPGGIGQGGSVYVPM